MVNFSILIADDSEAFQKFLLRYIKKIDNRYIIFKASNGLEALKIIEREDINLAFLDNIMPEYSGMEVLKNIIDRSLKTEVVIVSGYANIDIAVEAIKNGALGVIEKPILNFNIINQYIEKAKDKIDIKKRWRDRGVQKVNFIGQSGKIIDLKKLIENIASSNSNIFIMGESGTGKDIVAKMIHQYSSRSTKELITLNCSAIPETLIESELFGYKKGAFTGAISDRIGVFKEADKSTLFLDEIGDMPIFTQAKLLRAIQNKEIKPIGSTQTFKVDVRIVAATNKNIPQEIIDGNFREDLWYRLNVFSLEIPPLRERKEDIILLVYHFIDKFNKVLDKTIKDVDQEVLNLFNKYHWPGNVRELENVIERMVVLEKGTLLKTDNLPKKILKTDKKDYLILKTDENFSGMKFQDAKKIIVEKFEKKYIDDILKKTDGNISKAARIAGMDRSNFKKIIKKYKK